MTGASPGAWGAVAWQAVGNTLFGYAAWSWLLTRYDAAVIAPYALLIPIFGMGSSALLLGEALPAWKLAAAAMVVNADGDGGTVAAPIVRDVLSAGLGAG